MFSRIAIFSVWAALAVVVGSGQMPSPNVPQTDGSTASVAAGPRNPASGVSPTTPGSDLGPLESVFSAGTIVPSTNTRPQMATAGDLIGFSHADGSGNLTITLVHTGKSWMSVYHVDSKGTIRLASSRPLDADFSLQLNATDPLPEDIRAMNQRVRSGR